MSNNLNSKIFWCSGSIQIITNIINNNEITQTLGVVPSRFYNKGDRYNKSTNRIHDENMWILKSGLPRAAPFEEHLKVLLNFLEERDTAIQKLQKDCSIDLVFGMTGKTIAFPVDIIQRIARYKIGIIFDLYLVDYLEDEEI